MVGTIHCNERYKNWFFRIILIENCVFWILISSSSTKTFRELQYFISNYVVWLHYGIQIRSLSYRVFRTDSVRSEYSAHRHVSMYVLKTSYSLIINREQRITTLICVKRRQYEFIKTTVASRAKLIYYISWEHIPNNHQYAVNLISLTQLIKTRQCRG